MITSLADSYYNPDGARGSTRPDPVLLERNRTSPWFWVASLRRSGLLWCGCGAFVDIPDGRADEHSSEVSQLRPKQA